MLVFGNLRTLFEYSSAKRRGQTRGLLSRGFFFSFLDWEYLRQFSERFWHNGGTVEGPPNTHRMSQHYGTEGFKGGALNICERCLNIRAQSRNKRAGFSRAGFFFSDWKHLAQVSPRDLRNGRTVEGTP